MDSNIVQRGISIGDGQISQLARPAVELAEVAVLVQTYKGEVKAMRTRPDVRASELSMMTRTYKDSKRRFRERLAQYKAAKEEL